MGISLPLTSMSRDPESSSFPKYSWTEYKSDFVRLVLVRLCQQLASCNCPYARAIDDFFEPSPADGGSAHGTGFAISVQ